MKKGLMAMMICVLVVISFGSGLMMGAEEQAIEEKDDRINVVVSIVPLAEFVENVGGKKVDVTVMVPQGASPHTYEPKPSQLVDVSEADMFVKVGSGVEFELVWMDKITEQNRDIHIVDGSVSVKLMGKDPHMWNSPVNAMIMVENICNGLIEVDPDNADFYIQNKNNYLEELNILDGYIHNKLDRFENRTFMIYHPSFGYFADEYGLIQVPVEHDGKEPTPKVLKDCIDNAEAYNLEYVFVAPQFSTKHCETVADATGGQIAYMDPLAKNYISNMGYITDLLSLELET